MGNPMGGPISLSPGDPITGMVAGAVAGETSAAAVPRANAKRQKMIDHLYMHDSCTEDLPKDLRKGRSSDMIYSSTNSNAGSEVRASGSATAANASPISRRTIWALYVPARSNSE